ncbi:MAG TPA: hypothetical protein VFM93_09120 [Candidatus Limnocylindria bacterium]|nr:hypothetical protein [Candidatus Limnocylindria bacterium]
MTSRTFVSRRVDDALVFVSGTRVDGERLGRFLEEFAASGAAKDATQWSAIDLAAAFARRFGERVEVRRYVFSPGSRGVAFHIRAVDEAWAEKPAV